MREHIGWARPSAACFAALEGIGVPGLPLGGPVRMNGLRSFFAWER